jgi:hypothetical protein
LLIFLLEEGEHAIDGRIDNVTTKSAGNDIPKDKYIKPKMIAFANAGRQKSTVMVKGRHASVADSAVM